MKWSMKLFHKNQSPQHPFEQLFMHDLSIVETRFDYDLTKLEPVGKWIMLDILFLDNEKQGHGSLDILKSLRHEIRTTTHQSIVVSVVQVLKKKYLQRQS